MQTHRIKGGYEVPLLGQAERRLDDGPRPRTVGLCPARFYGIKPRLDVAVGQPVKIGSPLFHDRRNPRLRFCSPASGKISGVRMGPRRVTQEIQITCSGVEFEQFDYYRTHEISNLPRETLIEQLLNAGVWPFIRQRPFGTIPPPERIPSALFINCMDTAPLAPDPAFVLQGKEEEFKAGVEACRLLSPNGVHLVVDGARGDSFFTGVAGVQKHTFIGKHPAGLVGTHIHAIDPLGNHAKSHWFLNARDVVALGAFLLIGQFPADRVVTITGPAAPGPRSVRTQIGVRLAELTGEPRPNTRIISGNVLSGTRKEADGFLDFYDDQVTVLPEGTNRNFITWLLPGFGRWSSTRAFASAFFPGKQYRMHTFTNGEPRAFVQTGLYEDLVALDVLPDFLARAILAGDVELMEQLGILECDPEDFALCSYVCPSKIEFTEIIRSGLAMMEAEIQA